MQVSSATRPFYHYFWGRVPLLKQTTEENGPLILTSLLEDLGFFGSNSYFSRLCHWDWNCLAILSTSHECKPPEDLEDEALSSTGVIGFAPFTLFQDAGNIGLLSFAL